MDRKRQGNISRKTLESIKHISKKFLWTDVDPNIPNKYMRWTQKGGPSKENTFWILGKKMDTNAFYPKCSP